MKVMKPDIDKMKQVIYTENSLMLNPSDEYRKPKMQGTVIPINPNTRVIRRGK